MSVFSRKWYMLKHYGSWKIAADSHPWNMSAKEKEHEEHRDAQQTKARVQRAFRKHGVRGVQVLHKGDDVYVRISRTDTGPVTSALSKEGLSHKKIGDGTYKVYIPEDLTPETPENLKLYEKFRRHAQYSSATTGDGTETGLFIPVPESLASKYPSARGGNDKSPPHITLLYIGRVDPDREQEVKDVIQTVLDRLVKTPVRASLGRLGYFQQPAKNRRVALCPVQFNTSMSVVRDGIWHQLQKRGFDVEDSFPTYIPHSTLQYLEGLDTKYEGPSPGGSSFPVDRIELWGASKPHSFCLRSDQ